MGIASHVEFFLFAAPIQELTRLRNLSAASPPNADRATTGFPTLSHVEDRQGPEDQDEEPSQVRSAAAAISAHHLTARTTPRARHDPARHQVCHQARTTARACRTGS